MKLATIKRDDETRAALVIEHPLDGTLWAVPASSTEHPVGWTNASRTAQELITETLGQLDCVRRAEKAWREHLGDHAAGADGNDTASTARDMAAIAVPLRYEHLLSPIPAPPLIFGLVGNNAAFVRADHTRARNLQLPTGHARPPRSFVGPGDSVRVPDGVSRCSATTELGVVVSRPARNIAPADAMQYVAGYTIVNDLVVDYYTQRVQSGGSQYDINTPTGFHVANSASWLDKSVDSMCSIGPWIVTPDEIPDPYDLVVSFEANGVRRDRAYSGTLLVGVDQLVSWASHLIPLEPGAVLHLGAMGRDGIPTDLEVLYRDGTVRIASEIERIGVLSNVVSTGPATSCGDLASHVEEVQERRSFWAMLGNSACGDAYQELREGHPPIVYNTPASALASNHSRLSITTPIAQLVISAEVAVIIDQPIRNTTPDEVRARLRGYALLLSLHDESIVAPLLSPHRLPRNMPTIYARWREQFNVLGETVPSLDSSQTVTCMVNKRHAECAELSGYTLSAETAIAELSAHITMWPGDVVTLGILTKPINLGLLPSSSNDEIVVEAYVAGGPAVSATLVLQSGAR